MGNWFLKIQPIYYPSKPTHLTPLDKINFLKNHLIVMGLKVCVRGSILRYGRNRLMRPQHGKGLALASDFDYKDSHKGI
jgi:hypothetical protein